MSQATKITKILPKSPASKTSISQGDVLRKINAHVINDVLDYEYYSYDSRLLIEVIGEDNKVKHVRLTKPEGDDLGLVFETYLMDEQRSCRNNCIFCFIDQLPKGMRESLYYKDDDVRLSFLQGNYVTLTNLTEQEIRRIIQLRISPINVSIHTMNPVLKQYMLGKQEGGSSSSLGYFKQLAEAGIMLNCQIVCCPGINDGVELSNTIEAMIKLGDSINSVSIVPVGLTNHRQGLAQLRPYDKNLALETVRQVEHYGKECLTLRGSRVFCCADEFYMMAELPLPPEDFYEDYPQLENGVGMMRLFITEFEEAVKKGSYEGNRQVSIATGELAAPYLEKLLQDFERKYVTMSDKLSRAFNVFPIKNSFFGESVTVSGLITGKDIIKQLKDKKLGSKLLIPQNMLRYDDDVFLDDLTVEDVSKALKAPIRIVALDGGELFRVITEDMEHNYV